MPTNQQLRQSILNPSFSGSNVGVKKFGANKPESRESGGSNVRSSIARASMSFNLKDGTEAGDLVIENDRLKTTVQILN